jgi:hypothetical protein
MRRPHSVIPSENATPARTDGSRHEILTVTPGASSTPLCFAQNDGVGRHDP